MFNKILAMTLSSVIFSIIIIFLFPLLVHIRKIIAHRNDYGKVELVSEILISIVSTVISVMLFCKADKVDAVPTTLLICIFQIEIFGLVHVANFIHRHD